MIKQLIALLKNNFIASGLSYFLTLTIANKLGPSSFGDYSYILLWGNFFSMLVVFGSDNIAPRLFSNLKSIEACFIRIAGFRVCTLLVIVTLTCIISNEYLFSFGVFTILLSSLNLAFLFELKEDNIRYSYIYMIERVAYTSFSLILIYFFNGSIVNIFTIMCLSIVCSLIYQYNHFSKLIKSLGLSRYRLSFFGDIIRNNSYLVFISISTYAYGGFSRIFLKAKFSSFELGIYSAGWQFVVLATIIQASVDRVWRKNITKALVEGNYVEFKRCLTSYIKFTTVPIVLLSMVFAYFSSFTVELFFNSDYFQLKEILPIIGLYFIVVNLNSLSTISWVAIGNKSIFLIVNIMFSISLLICLWLLGDSLTLFRLTLLVVTCHGLSAVSLLLIIYKHNIKSIKAKYYKSLAQH